MRRLSKLRSLFRQVFRGSPDAVVRAPGRVNLIGEHTDYNEGFVLPLAIDRDLLLAARSRSDDIVAVYTGNYDRMARFKLGEIVRDGVEPWSNYVRGVAAAMAEQGIALCGMDMAISGDIPTGAGLSSSAALEMAVAWAWRAVAGLALDPIEVALLCQRAENEFVGVRSGIMDQFVAAFGRRGHAVFLDCRDLSYRHVPLPDGFKVVVTDSLLRRELAGSAYNERRMQCAEGVQLLRAGFPDIRALRDVSLEQLAIQDALLPDVVRRRCRHVVSENDRVLQAVVALERGDVLTMGNLMDEAHRSLRDDYEVSLPELDLLVAAAREAGSIGSRLTGAGFGGCIVSLVPAGAVAAFGQAVGEQYLRRTGRWAESYVCQAGDGVAVVA